MLDRDVLSCGSNLTLVHNRHIVNVLVDIRHQIQLRIPDLLLSVLVLLGPLRLHLLLLSDNSSN